MFGKLKDIFEVVKETLASPKSIEYDYESEKERLLLQERALRAFHEAGQDPEKLLAAGELIDQCWTDDRPNLAYSRLIELHPDNADYHALLGKSILRYGAGSRVGCAPLDPTIQEFAIRHLELAIDLEPNHLMAYEALAEAHSELLQMAEEADESPEVLRDKVIHYFRRVNEIDPTHEEAHINLANYLVEADRFEEAEPFIKSYLALSRKGYRWERAAGTYTQAGQHEKARELLERQRQSS